MSGARPKPISELRGIARAAVQDAWRREMPGYVYPPEAVPPVLGEYEEADGCLFELYRPGERAEDAIVLASARVDGWTGECAVEIFSDRMPRG